MKRSCGIRVVALARRGNCAAAVRAFHKAKLYTHCTDARIGQVRGAIHACLAKGNFRDGAPAPAPAAPKAAAPAAAPVAGWWPFGKKAPKKLSRDPRKMAQTVMYIPSPSGRVNQVMRGAKRRRR
jgi:hypothetical protein